MPPPNREQILAAALAPDVPRYNLLTNPSFERWQRGNGPFTGSVYTADRWAVSVAGTDTISVTRDTANADGGVGACAACVFTLGTGAGGTQLYNVWPAADGGAVYAGKWLAHSMRVKCAVPNAVRLASYDGVVGSYSPYHSGSGQYETLTVMVRQSNNAVQVQISLFFAASCTAYVDNGAIVPGTSPMDGYPLHPHDDLARCQRYYRIWSGPAAGEFNWSFHADGNGVSSTWGMPLSPSMPINPASTKSGTWAVSQCGQPTFGASVDQLSFTIVATATGFAYTQNTGGGVTLEANP